MRKKILAAFDDPGGGLAVMAVLKKIANEDKADVTVYAGDPGRKFVMNLFDDVKKLRSDLTRDEALNILDTERPDILLTATGGGKGEQELRNVADMKNLSSFVVLDFWKHYKRRWLYADYEIEQMKDFVFVPDENVRDEMIREGFPGDKIVASGQPYLDEIFNCDQNKLRNSPNSDSYLFLSQPSETIGLKGYSVHPVEAVLRVLNELQKNKNSKVTLYLKLHPLEKITDELSEIINSVNDTGVEVIFKDSDDDIKELINDCMTVIGYNSIALFEAAARGRRVLSLDIVPMENSLRAAMKSAGIEIIMQDNLPEALSTASLARHSIAPGFHKGSIDNIIRRIFPDSQIQQSHSI